MRVKMETWRGVQEMDLQSALTPALKAYEADGQVERAQVLADKTATAVGRMLTVLVEKGVLSLEEAGACVDEHSLEVVS